MSAERTVSDFNGIDFVSKIDFKKGFSSYHIRWPIDISLLNAAGFCFSNNFETSAGSENPAFFKWYLQNQKTEDKSIDFCLFKEGLPVPTAMNFRFALTSENNKSVICNHAGFMIFAQNDFYPYCITLTDELKASLANGNFVFHCWLDIPNDIQPKTNLRKRKRVSDDDEIDLIDNNFRLKGSEDLSADFVRMYGDIFEESANSLSDVKIVILDKEKKIDSQFFCHRNVLAYRSPVFRTMFGSNRWREDADGDRTVEIVDIDTPTMELVLCYIYTGYITSDRKYWLLKLDCADWLKLVNAAEKYMLPKLKEFCTAQLIYFHGTEEERFEQFLVADLFDMPQLKEVCLAALSSNFQPIKDAPADLMKDLYEATAKRNLEMKEIRVTTEED